LDEGEEANVTSKRRVRAARRAGAGNNHCDILVEVMIALRREQIPFMVAPYEADGQLAYFQSQMKMIDLVVTEDSDLIAQGCHSILYKTAEELGKGSASGILVQRGDLSAKGLMPKCLSLVDFSDVMLAVMFVALGCDYCSSLKQIGSVAARDIVRDAFHGEKNQSKEDPKRPALEKTFERLYEKTSAKDLTDEFKQEYEASFLAALLMYRHPMVYDPFAKKCVLLRNPPHGSDPELMDYEPYADLCGDVKRREEILGTCHGSVLSTRIAEGWLNPRTKRPYENMVIPSKVKDVPLSLSASDSDSEEETQAQTQEMSPKPTQHATDTAVEDSETQDDRHVETQLGTPSPAQNWSKRQSVEGHGMLDNSGFETQPSTQDPRPTSKKTKIYSSSHTFTITFETKKLCILLNGILEIASVMNNTLEKTLKIGDTLVAINGSRVGNASLEEVQKRLMNLPRPVKITFSRAIVAIDDDSQGDKSIASVVDLTQDDSPPVARLRAVETTQTSASSASRLASQPSQPSTGSQISAEVYSPNLL
jgi:hypothetical protein